MPLVRSDFSADSRVFLMTALYDTTIIDARMAITVTTIISSTIVKPERDSFLAQHHPIGH